MLHLNQDEIFISLPIIVNKRSPSQEGFFGFLKCTGKLFITILEPKPSCLSSINIPMKIIKGILFSAFALLVLSFPFLLSGAVQFSDIQPSSTFFSAVENAAAWKVMSGFSDGTFKPDECVKRSELATAFDHYNNYLETKFAPMQGSLPTITPPSKRDLSVLDTTQTFKCTSQKRQFCQKAICTDMKSAQLLTIQPVKGLVSRCFFSECDRIVITHQHKGNTFTVKRKSKTGNAWEVNVDVPNMTYIETYPLDNGSFITTGTCVNVSEI